MRLKRHKDYKRYMNMYCQTFHFRKPYQVLVDADFIQTALDQRIDLRTQIPAVLCDASKQMVTPCTMAELRSRGEDASGAFIASKRFEKRRCKHQTAVSESQCLAEIISTTNPHNYVVATQSKQLRVQFATKVAGVPLLYIKRANMILEPPSEMSVKTVKKLESDKTHVSEKELQALKAVKVTAGGKVSMDVKIIKKLEEKKEHRKQKLQEKKAKILKKRAGPKEPNPLSVKKKKPKTTTTPATTGTTSTAATTGATQPAGQSRKRKEDGSDATAAAGDGGAPDKKKRKRKKSRAEREATLGSGSGAVSGSESS
ncbi:hypothetical protein BGZ99_010426 [Dissophora globulifera]|uniref:U three protein 23 n=1 Tax=Dissophora globulifera TaxID=979702 RepID=A0A9P6RSN3_9FUNG|nr:hypothetical protein BGZ99_010426 [Dissophora globulifera]